MTSARTGYPPQEQDLIYALDIGTRSVIGMLGRAEEGRVNILALEKQPHTRRAMLDGQIEDIAQVAQAVAAVTRRLEQRIERTLTHACVAAAGRALRTEQGHSTLELPAPELIQAERIGQLEAQAVANAEQMLREEADQSQRLFLVGYTATRLALDHYPMTNLLGHTGQNLEADVVATFLPSEVIDSLYAVLRQAGLEVASLTLEPIAALNAAIPADLRLLNLALVDIGAGTSDIAICRDGSVVGYTMATVAGDEITEAIMRACLVDYPTAERIKEGLGQGGKLTYRDVLGLDQSMEARELLPQLEQATQNLVEEISQRVAGLNGGPPSALFLAGGGSKLAGLQERVAQALGMDPRRVAVAGARFQDSAFSEAIELEDPEYTTPLGIAVSAGLGLISDSYRVQLNGAPAKLFRSGSVTVLELLMMNGYTYADLLGRGGRSLVLKVDGKRMVIHGEPATPALLEVNGAEAPPSRVVHAGDQIHFEPAKPGADAQMTAGALEKRLGGPILVNGVHPPAAQMLSGEDPIHFRTPAPSPAAAQPVLTREPESPAEPAVQTEAARPVEPVSGPAAPIPQTPDVLQTQPVPRTEPMPQAEPAPRPAAPAAPGTAASGMGPNQGEGTRSVGSYTFYLNRRPLRLPAKSDGSPYYLMDLLEYSGIDFDHVEHPVLLRVNGTEAGFSQVLTNGDRVEIRYDT